MFAILNMIVIEAWLAKINVTATSLVEPGVLIFLLFAFAITVAIDFSYFIGRVCSFIVMGWYFGSIGRLMLEFDFMIGKAPYPINEALAISIILPFIIFLAVFILPHISKYNYQYIKGKITRVS